MRSVFERMGLGRSNQEDPSKKPTPWERIKNSSNDFVIGLLAMALRDDELLVPYRPTQKNDDSLENASDEELDGLIEVGNKDLNRRARMEAGRRLNERKKKKDGAGDQKVL